MQEMMAACSLSGVPSLQGEVTFALPSGPKGKRTNNDVTRNMLGGWAPKYESFEAFMRGGAEDFFNTSGLY